MPIILAALTVAIQIYFIVHVFRTGRPYWWAFIILSMPLLGSVIYYLVEIFPNSRQERDTRKAVRNVVKAFNPDADLHRRAEELEKCGSVDNRLALAEECELAGMHEDAVKLYESALSGPYATDANIRLRLAQALLAGSVQPGAMARVRELIAAMRADTPDFRPGELRLLEARALQAEGDKPGAIALYEQLLPVAIGLETRTRYALLLHEMGHVKQAHGEFEAVVTHARRFNLQHPNEQQWLDRAKSYL